MKGTREASLRNTEEEEEDAPPIDCYTIDSSCGKRWNGARGVKHGQHQKGRVRGEGERERERERERETCEDRGSSPQIQ